MSNYIEECQIVIAAAKAAGYQAVDIDLGGHGYEITALSPDNNVRTLLARCPCWALAFSEAMEYLAGMNQERMVCR